MLLLVVIIATSKVILVLIILVFWKLTILVLLLVVFLKVILVVVAIVVVFWKVILLVLIVVIVVIFWQNNKIISSNRIVLGKKSFRRTKCSKRFVCILLFNYQVYIIWYIELCSISSIWKTLNWTERQTFKVILKLFYPIALSPTGSASQAFRCSIDISMEKILTSYIP